jgi:DNA-binding cell septation regulator SpoVG
VKEFNDLMRKQKVETGKKGVLMDMRAKRVRENELNELQHLPSIPTS